MIQLPGVDDPQSAERVLGTTAQLEFRRENPEKIRLLTVRQEELRELLTKQQDLQKKKIKPQLKRTKPKLPINKSKFLKDNNNYLRKLN